MSSAPLVLLAPTSPAAPLFWPGRGRQQITQADHAPRSQCHQYTWMSSKYTPKNCTHKTMMPLFPTLPGDKHLFLSLLCPTHSSLLFSMPLHFLSSVPLLLLLHAPTLPLLHAPPSLSITPLSFFSSLPLPLHHTPPFLLSGPSSPSHPSPSSSQCPFLSIIPLPPSPSHPSPSPHCPFLSITPLPFFSVPLPLHHSPLLLLLIAPSSPSHPSPSSQCPSLLVQRSLPMPVWSMVKLEPPWDRGRPTSPSLSTSSS